MAESKITQVVNPKTDGYVGDKLLDKEVEDQIAVRDVTVSDGRRFLVRSKDPYGLWFIQPRRGPVPNSLQGMYTTQRDAEQAILRYCGQHPKNG